MRTSIDTNIISIILTGTAISQQLSNLLGRAGDDGALVICGPVYAELMAYPNMTETYLHGFLTQTRVEVDFAIDEPVWREAGRKFAEYASRRRESAGSKAKRLLTDFIIGAHALLYCDRLCTLDTELFSKNFPKLQLIGSESL